MKNQEELCKITELPKKMLVDLSRIIDNYSTGLIKVTTTSGEKKLPLLIGSGTFVSILNTYGIITAAHVIDLLVEPYSLGLILSEHEHNYMINSEYLDIIRIAKGKVDSAGPDLGFIAMPSSELGTIQARKSFHNLDIKRDRILANPPGLDHGIWALYGVPDINTMDNPLLKCLN